MKVKLYDYIKDCSEKVQKEKIDEDFIQDLLTWIQFFQHERFVHLLVTVFVGISAILFLIASLMIDNILLVVLFVLLLALFIPYIFHYYNLENGVQKLYDIYHDACEKQK